MGFARVLDYAECNTNNNKTAAAAVAAAQGQNFLWVQVDGDRRGRREMEGR